MSRHIVLRAAVGAVVLVVVVGGKALASGAAAQVALAWAIGALVVLAAMLVFAWSWNTRDLCLSDHWVACKTRISSRWRLLSFSEVVAVVPGRYGLGVQLRRGDGRSLTIAPAELTPAVVEALLAGLAENPALNSPAGDRLRARQHSS